MLAEDVAMEVVMMVGAELDMVAMAIQDALEDVAAVEMIPETMRLQLQAMQAASSNDHAQFLLDSTANLAESAEPYLPSQSSSHTSPNVSHCFQVL